MIEKHCPNFKVVGKAKSVKDAIPLIRSEQPDAVLLDISMPGESGFDLLEKCPPVNFEVVFLTAYNEYALQAMRASAVDFLLKPLNAIDLVKALGMVIVRRNQINSIERYEQLMQRLDEQKRGGKINKIAIPAKNGYVFVKVKDIIWAQAQGEYSEIKMSDGEKHVISKNLGVIEELIDNDNFFRIHRSTLINLKYIEGILTNEGCDVLMETGDKFPVARSRKRDLFDILNL